MSESFSTLSEAMKAIVKFRNERNWEEHHVPRHLVNALSIEASELQEEFLWKDPADIADYLRSSEGEKRVRDEIADVMIYALLFCESTEISPLDAIRDKLDKNAEKYPAEVDTDKV